MLKIWTYLNSKFEFQVFPSLLENTQKLLIPILGPQNTTISVAYYLGSPLRSTRHWIARLSQKADSFFLFSYAQHSCIREYFILSFSKLANVCTAFISIIQSVLEQLWPTKWSSERNAPIGQGSPLQSTPLKFRKDETCKEVQIVCRLFLVNCYLLHGNILHRVKQIETEVFTIYVGGLVIHWSGSAVHFLSSNINCYDHCFVLRQKSKANSVQEACIKCLAVHTLKFEILKPAWKTKPNFVDALVFSLSNISS